MADERIDAYAKAMLEVARAEGSIDRVEEELFRFARTLEQAEELREKLTDASLPVNIREGIVSDLLRDRALPITTALVTFIVGAGRARQLPAIVDRLVQLAADERSEAVAEVRSSIPLDDDRRQRLAEALSRKTGKKVSVKVIVDPSVLGGVIAQVGDTVIDGSVRSRLNQLKEVL